MLRPQIHFRSPYNIALNVVPYDKDIGEGPSTGYQCTGRLLSRRGPCVAVYVTFKYLSGVGSDDPEA